MFSQCARTKHRATPAAYAAYAATVAPHQSPPSTLPHECHRQVRNGETNLADLMCEAMLQYTKANTGLLQANPDLPPVCLINGGVIRWGGSAGLRLRHLPGCTTCQWCSGVLWAACACKSLLISAASQPPQPHPNSCIPCVLPACRASIPAGQITQGLVETVGG